MKYYVINEETREVADTCPDEELAFKSAEGMVLESETCAQFTVCQVLGSVREVRSVQRDKEATALDPGLYAPGTK